MKRGISVFETYEGPKLDAVEFSLHDDNKERRLEILNDLSSKFDYVSAHLPSFLDVHDIHSEVAFDNGKVNHFVAHITKRSSPIDWKNAWKDYVKCGKKILFENHNLDWHETDTGFCWPDEFKPLVDAGYSLCLDVGHILQASSFKSTSELHWQVLVEETFEGFLQLPIEAVHAHTMNCFQGMDHYLDGFDISPWLHKIANKYPDTVFLVETPYTHYTIEDKIAALDKWLPAS